MSGIEIVLAVVTAVLVAAARIQQHYDNRRRKAGNEQGEQ